MKKMNYEDFKENVAGKTLEDVIEKIKTLPVYQLYEKRVKEEDCEETYKFLETMAMLCALTDDGLLAMMNSVSMDLMFSMIDMRLRAEILEESEVEEE